MAKAKFNTTIRMGAAHYDLTLEGFPRGPLTFDLSKCTRKDKEQAVTHIVDLHGIEGERKRYHPHRAKGDKLNVSDHQTRNTKGPRHGTANGVPSGQTPRQDEAQPVGKKRRRRRSATLPVPDTGHVA